MILSPSFIRRFMISPTMVETRMTLTRVTVKTMSRVPFSGSAKNVHDIDFIVKEGMNVSKRIQVWYDDPSAIEIPDREFTGFHELLPGSDRVESLLLTNDYEDRIDLGGVQVRCVTVVKYLLGLG